MGVIKFEWGGEGLGAVFLFFPVKTKSVRESHFWHFLPFFSRVQNHFHARIFYIFHGQSGFFTDTFKDFFTGMIFFFTGRKMKIFTDRYLIFTDRNLELRPASIPVSLAVENFDYFWDCFGI